MSSADANPAPLRVDRIDRELLAQLSSAAGPPGFEGDVRKIVHEICRPLGELRHDAHGSVICEFGLEQGPRVVLDAHMDEVGFMVQSIDADGRLAFLPLGGWWGHVLLGQRVDILAAEPAASTVTPGPQRVRKIPGVIASKPPHFLSEAERNSVLSVESMTIDVGASCLEEVVALGIREGDGVVPSARFQEMGVAGVLSGKAFDDRAGVGVLLESARFLSQHGSPNRVVAVAAVQEELGCRGAKSASTLARPDVGIILEGTPADDMPGVGRRQGALGRGPQIRFYDPTALSNRRLARFVEDVAQAEKIPVQRAIRRSGGTDASSVHLHASGVPTVVIGVPCRYIHTHVALLQWQDYVDTIRLVTAVVQRLDAVQVASFCDYSTDS